MPKNNSNNWFAIFFFSFARQGLLLLAFSICIYTLYLSTAVASWTIDADIIQLPTMLIDFQSNLANLWGWNLPDAPYYFPDTIVFLTVGWIVKNPLASIIIYSLVQNYLLFWSLRWLYCELGGKKTLVYDLCFLLAAVIFTYYHPDNFSNFPNIKGVYLINLLSYHHFGTYVATIFCLAACFHYLRTNDFKILIIGGLVTLLTTASDFLFALYFTIPLLTAVGTLFKLKLFKLEQVKAIYLVFSIPSLIAYIFNKLIDPWVKKFGLRLDFEKVIDSTTKVIYDITVRLNIQEQLLLLCIVVLPVGYFLYSTCIDVLKLKKNGDYATQQPSILLSQLKQQIITRFCLKLFILLTIVFNLISVLGLGKYTDSGSMRYFIPIYYSPLIFSLLLLSLSIEKLNSKYLKIIQTSLAVAISAIIFMLASSLEIKPVTEVFTPPNYAACFDRGAIAGLAGYWESKPIILFSQRQVQIATITDNGEPYYWNNNRYWYEDSWTNPGNKPQFKFIFMRSLKPQAIIQKYGQPDRTESCDDSEIWWYDNPEQIYSKLMNDF